MINSASSIVNKDSDDTSSFTFNPHCKPVSLPRYSGIQNQHPHKSLAPSSQMEVEFQYPAVTHPPRNECFEIPTQLQTKVTVDSSEFSSVPNSEFSNDMAAKAHSVNCQLSDSHGAAAAIAAEMQQTECHQGEDREKQTRMGIRKLWILQGELLVPQKMDTVGENMGKSMSRVVNFLLVIGGCSSLAGC